MTSVPEFVGIDVEARIAELAAARRPLLAELVREAVDRELVAPAEAAELLGDPSALLRTATCTRSPTTGSSTG